MHFTDLSFDPALPGYFDGLLRSMRSDPDWKPEKFGFTSEQIEDVAAIRSNRTLMSALRFIHIEAVENDPANQMAELKYRYPAYDWETGPLAEWDQKIGRERSAIQHLNDPKTCSDIPLINVGPIREQQNPWCAAMVAADLLGQNTGIESSAAFLMLKLQLRAYKPGGRILAEVGVDQPLFTGTSAASIGQVVNVGLEDGICRESNFKSGFVNGEHSSMILRRFLQQSSQAAIDDSTLNAARSVFGELGESSAMLRQSYHPFLINEIAAASCGAAIHVKARLVDHFPLNLQLTSQETASSALEIDSVLERQRIVGVGLKSDSIAYNPAINDTNGHAVSIVGRRFNEGSRKCEYLIRNSAGTSWGDQGYKFVPRTKLLPSLSEIIYLD